MLRLIASGVSAVALLSGTATAVLAQAYPT